MPPSHGHKNGCACCYLVFVEAVGGFSQQCVLAPVCNPHHLPSRQQAGVVTVRQGNMASHATRTLCEEHTRMSPNVQLYNVRKVLLNLQKL